MKDYKKKKRKYRGLKLLLILIVLLIIQSFLCRVKIIEVNGTERYNSEELRKYIITNKFKNNSWLLYMENKMKSNYNIPYIKSIDLRLSSFNKIQLNVEEKTIPYQIEFDNKIYDISEDFKIEGISTKQNTNSIILKGYDIESLSIGEDVNFISENDKNIIKYVYYNLSSAKINDFNELLLKDNIILSSKKMKVEFGTGEDIEKKIKVLVNAYPKIKNLSGTLYLNEFKNDDSGYQFKKISE